MGYEQLLPLHGYRAKDICYLYIWVWKLESQTLDARAQHHVNASCTGDFFQFIAPNEIQETHRHNWKEFDTITGRAGQAFAAVGNNLRQIGGITQGEIGAYRMKADTPLVYEDSDRRTFSFTVKFLDQEDPAGIVDCVDQIRRYAAANVGGEGGGFISKIDFPNIFEIYTVPKNFINIRYAALTDFQTSYKYPFMGGDASDIDMTLTFIDLEPLYKTSFNARAGVSTS